MFPIILKKLREQEGISQQNLADIIGVTQQAVAKWENGKSEPDTATLSKLASYFGTSIDYLIGRTDIKNPPETIAAHHDGDEWTEEELEDIEKFKEFVRMRREKRGED